MKNHANFIEHNFAFNLLIESIGQFYTGNAGRQWPAPCSTGGAGGYSFWKQIKDSFRHIGALQDAVHGGCLGMPPPDVQFAKAQFGLCGSPNLQGAHGSTDVET